MARRLVTNQQTTETPTNPVAQQPSFVEGLGQGIVNIGADIARPFVNTGKKTLGAGYELGRAVLSGGGANPEYYYDSKAGKTVQNPFMSEEELNRASNLGTAALDTSKDTAGIMSWAIPYGKGANLLTKATLPSAVQAGMMEYARPNSTTNSVVGSAAMGGAIGTAIPLAERAFKAIGGKLTGAGKAARESVLNPQVGADPFYAQNTDKMLEIQKQIGLKGSGSAQIRQVGEKFNSLTDDIGQALKESNIAIPVNDVRGTLQDSVKKLVNYDAANPAWDAAIQKFQTQLENTSKQGMNGMNLQKVYSYKQNLGDQLKNAFAKLEKRVPLTPQEEAGVSIYRAINDIVGGAAPQVKQMTGLQSKLFDMAPGLVKSAKAGTTIPVPFAGGIKVSGQPMQALKDATGRTLESAGGAMDNIANATKGVIGDTGKAAIERAGGVSPLMNAPQNGGQDDPTKQGQVLGASIADEYDKAVGGNTGTIKITPQMVSNAYLALPKDQADQVKAAYDAMKGSADEQKITRAKEGSKRIIDQIEKMYFDKNLAQGRVGGFFGGVGAAAGFNPDQVTYESLRQSIRPTLARAAGDVGNMTETEQQAAVALVPTSYNTPEEAKQMFAALRQKFGVTK